MEMVITFESPSMWSSTFQKFSMGSFPDGCMTQTSSWGSGSAARLHSQIRMHQKSQQCQHESRVILGYIFLQAARAEPSSCVELPGKQHMGTKESRSSDPSPQTSHQTRLPPPFPPTTSIKRKHMMLDMCSNTHTHLKVLEHELFSALTYGC